MFYRPGPDCVACAYGEGIAVLSVRSNEYFGLDPVGATVWNSLGEGADLDSIIAAVVSEFDVTPEGCAADVTAFLTQLEQAKLIESVP